MTTAWLSLVVPMARLVAWAADAHTRGIIIDYGTRPRLVICIILYILACTLPRCCVSLPVDHNNLFKNIVLEDRSSAESWDSDQNILLIIDNSTRQQTFTGNYQCVSDESKQLIVTSLHTQPHSQSVQVQYLIYHVWYSVPSSRPITTGELYQWQATVVIRVE